MNHKGIDFIIFIISVLLVSIVTVIGIILPNPVNGILIFILDTNGNIGGTIVASFFLNCFYTNISLHNRIIIALSAGFGLIIYEFLQLFIKWQTFDQKDIVGSVIGSIISISINFLIYKKDKKIHGLSES
jgi:glycopeptide antibiotics resistance protein